MKCEKCGGDFPHKKGRYCGTCNWNSPTFDAALARRKREGKKLGQHIWQSGAPKPMERIGGFSMTVMEMEELTIIRATLQVAVEALKQIAVYDKNSKYGEGCCDYGCDTPSIAKKALSRMGVKL